MFCGSHPLQLEAVYSDAPSLVKKTAVPNPPQLEAVDEEEQMEQSDFGSHTLYRNLGYFSLIGLLRLHTQLGDYYQALQCVTNVQLSKKVTSRFVAQLGLTLISHPLLCEHVCLSEVICSRSEATATAVHCAVLQALNSQLLDHKM